MSDSFDYKNLSLQHIKIYSTYTLKMHINMCYSKKRIQSKINMYVYIFNM